LSSQDAYNELAGLLDESKGELLRGAWGAVGGAGLLLLSGIGGSFAPQLTSVQQVYAMLAVLLTWLSTVWLLRAILSGNRPALRDALYGSGGPLVASGLVFLAIFVQLLPIALAAIVVNTAISTGFVDGGLLAMLLWLIVGLLAVLSLYWITSTIMALVIVTLPGMYPWHAIRAAGDLVIGRRLRILIRLLWLIIMIGLFWVAIVLPTILIDGWLRTLIPWFDNIPLVPIVILLVTSLTTVVSSAYLYLLYRKVVDDDADPA